jgi:heme A synthase
MDTPVAHSEITTVSNAVGQSIQWIRRLVFINLGLVAVEALSAGFFLSGYNHAATIHRSVALALQLGALTQAVIAIVLWRRRSAPARVAGAGVVLLILVFLQAGLGFTKRFWVHVPIGVGIFGGLVQQKSRLDT